MMRTMGGLLAAVCLAACGGEATDRADVPVPAQPVASAAVDLGNGPFEASWSSVEARPEPAWFRDAKFGIFIHWGPYAVPAYAPVGNYAEWYGESMNPVPSSAYIGEHHAELRAQTRAWHVKTYGEDFDYARFAPMWRAELWEPGDWADIFKDAGARYVVLTSKHHDGFALWPSAHASASWGRPWNSVEVGPGRDVVGELSEAVRDAGLRMGLCYSNYEWYNPLYTNDPTDTDTVARFMDTHFRPQLRDLITRYQPDILWGDGAWDHPSEVWGTPAIMAWMLNTHPRAEDVVFNDRWGNETRLGVGVHTSEYGAGRQASDPLWEENRGIGHSYGYNRMEDIADYATRDELVMLLVDVVSRGGNLLLDVGPDADGKIPPIQQERLRQIGAWLDVYGAGIFGTRAYRDGAQWSDGPRPETSTATFKADYNVLRLTSQPAPGEARKTVLFTRKSDTLHAFLTRVPEGDTVLRGVTLGDGAAAHWLGLDGEAVAWRQEGPDLVLNAVPSPERIRLGPPYGIVLTGLEE